MSRTPFTDTYGHAGSVSGDSPQIVTAQGQDVITLPDAAFIKNADIMRDGPDLVLEGPDGSTIVIEGYFNAEPTPLLQAPTGETLSPQLVDSFVHSAGPLQYANAGMTTDESPVGAIQEVSGKATITRVNGSTEQIAIGTPVYEGDVIETDNGSAVNIVFIDETSFAISHDAKLAIDEYVFDPTTQSGTSDFSILRGLFVFTSGLIGRDDPDDVSIDTPMGSIGIRGTVIAGNVDTGEITVMEGAIVLRGFNGSELTLSRQFETARFDPSGGDIIHVGQTTSEMFDNNFSTIKAVAPTLFTAMQSDDGTPDSAAPEQSMEQPETEQVPLQGDVPPPPEGVLPPPDAAAPLPPPGSDPFFDNNLDAGFDDSAGLDNTGDGSTTAPLLNSPLPAGTDSALPPAPPPPANEPVAAADSPLPPPPTVDNGGTGGGSTPLTHINLASLIANGSGPAGKFIGGSGGQHLGDYVAAAGDFNNNGMPNFFVAENIATGGQIYVYGGTGGAITNLASAGSPTTALTAAALGDIDSDGITDFVIGSPDANTFGTGAGNASIAASGSSLIAFTNQDDSTSDAGLRGISSSDNGDMTGESVAGIGDINGDGLNDMIIGMPGRDTSGALDDSGSAYVVIGKSTMSNIDVDSGPVAGDFKLDGSMSDDFYGAEVSSAGDLDKDGYTDFMVSRAGQGEVDIFFGATSAAVIQSSVKTITGIGVDPGDYDIPLFNMGDINGDGMTDIAVAATNGAGTLYIFSGNDLASAGSTINAASGAMATITPGVAGFELIGGGGAGDWNGDGFDDGALAFLNGSQLEMFIFFGAPGGGSITMNDFANPNNAFHMSLDLSAYNVANPTNFDVEFANPGDLDGDGFDDLVIGMGDLNNGDGGVFIINGRNENKTDVNGNQVHIAHDTSPDNKVFANGDNQHLVGDNTANELNDKLATDAYGHGNISMRGGAGNDIFILNDFASGANIRDDSNLGEIDGGAGHDRLDFHGDGDPLDFAAVGMEGLSAIEEFFMMGNNQTIILGIDDIFRLLQQSDDGTLKISANGNTNNRLIIDNNGNTLMATGNITNATYLNTELDDVHDTSSASVSHSVSSGYDVFTMGGYQLEIESVLLDTTNPSQIV